VYLSSVTSCRKFRATFFATYLRQKYVTCFAEKHKKRA
jgi:hypothetical protein